VLRFRSPWLWTYNPLTLLYLPLKGFELSIYHAVDAVQEQPCMPRSLIESQEARLCRSVDQVFTTSPYLAEQLARHTDRICYEPNVADRDHFSASIALRQAPRFVDPPELAGIPEPKIGFVGAISSYKLDFGLIRAVALRHPEWHFVFIGPQSEGEPSTDLSQLFGLSNVHWLGPKPYSQLPRFLAAFQCAWLPLQCNGYTRAMFPMKFFEYLFAGLPVVSTRIHALRSFEAICSLCPPDPLEFSQQLQRVLGGEGPSLEKRLTGIDGYTYAGRTRRMLKLLRSQAECAG
jgi:glycosyltransferase involved in cell wall biosynthesis